MRTVRYYLEENLIQAEDRSPGGFYLFTPEVAQTVFYIRKLKDAGLALKDIKKIYHARHNGKTGDEAYQEVLKHLEAQKALVEQKIADYQLLESEIKEAIDLVRKCDGCRVKPSRQNCENCPVVKSASKIPWPVQAIL
ncbi:MAG: MerR family DNA-binding protein [Desulfobacterales bacterium]|nr:MerR family DNA-binding protein [Desulfobacterales bacterium]